MDTDSALERGEGLSFSWERDRLRECLRREFLALGVVELLRACHAALRGTKPGIVRMVRMSRP